jgi:phosphoglycolate phosphatase
LEHFGLHTDFDFICGAAMDESKRSRKDQVLAYALEQSGADANDSCMVGDRLFDIEAGKHFGLSTVGVLYGYGSREELEAAGADVLCETVENVREVLLT